MMFARSSVIVSRLRIELLRVVELIVFVIAKDSTTIIISCIISARLIADIFFCPLILKNPPCCFKYYFLKKPNLFFFVGKLSRNSSVSSSTDLKRLLTLFFRRSPVAFSVFAAEVSETVVISGSGVSASDA